MIDPEEAYMALNELRIIVLMEHPDGYFQQVALDDKRFKAVSDAIVAHKSSQQRPEDLPDDIEMVCTHFKPDWHIPADTFIGLSSITPIECDNELEDAPNA